MSDVQELLGRIEALEARVASLEAGGGARAPRRSGGSDGSAALDSIDVSGWTTQYVPAELEVSETWIELHEQSARPQLQRLVRQVVEEEGPVTDHLLIDRVRRAWGLRRAGGRVQEAFEQTIRQLVARGLAERSGDALSVPGRELEHVRVPGDDEATRRGAEDVPVDELALALRHVTQACGGRGPQDELTMRVAKVFGWTRRGGAIQTRLEAGIERAVARGELRRDGEDLCVSTD